LLLSAATLNLDMARWERDSSGRVFCERVQEDFLRGVRTGVNGTPTFFSNGTRHDGIFDAESLRVAVGPMVDGTVTPDQGVTSRGTLR
jgi:hypothetical protein